MIFAREGVGVYAGDEVVVERDGLHSVGDHLGGDRLELVEGDVHRVDVQLRFSIKIIADIFNFILMDIQPVERPSIFRFERELRFK